MKLLFYGLKIIQLVPLLWSKNLSITELFASTFQVVSHAVTSFPATTIQSYSARVIPHCSPLCYYLDKHKSENKTESAIIQVQNKPRVPIVIYFFNSKSWISKLCYIDKSKQQFFTFSAKNSMKTLTLLSHLSIRNKPKDGLLKPSIKKHKNSTKKHRFAFYTSYF